MNTRFTIGHRTTEDGLFLACFKDHQRGDTYTFPDRPLKTENAALSIACQLVIERLERKKWQ